MLLRNINLKQWFYYVQILVILSKLFIPHRDPTMTLVVTVCVANFEYAFVIQILLICDEFIVRTCD